MMRLRVPFARAAVVARSAAHGPRAARTLSAVPDLETYEKVLDTAPVSLGPAVKRVADSPLSPLDTFARRHIGPVGADATAMLEVGSRAAPSATRALSSP